MPRKLYLGTDTSGVRRAALENLKNHRGERNIVLVPDEYTFAIEQEVLDVLGAGCAFDVEVMSFSRYAERTVKDKTRLINKETGVMLLRRAIAAVSDNLKCFMNAPKMRSFAGEAYAAITNIRNSGITPENLAGIVPKLYGANREKTEDIALIYRAYADLLNEYTDMTGILEKLYGELVAGNEIETINYYVTDFIDIADIKLKLLELIALRADNVYAGMLQMRGKNKALISSVAAPLYGLYEETGFEKIEVPADFSLNKSVIADNLFGYGVNTLQDAAGEITLCDCANYLDELEYAARDIRRKVIREGLRYRDFAIMTPSIDDKRIDRILALYEVPGYINNRYLLINHGIYRCFRLASEAAGFGKDSMIALAKEQCTGIDFRDAERFENYVLLNGTDGCEFLGEFSDPAAERVRISLIELVRLSASGDTPREFRENKAEFLNSLKVDTENPISAQIPERIRETLDSIVDIFDETGADRKILDDAFFSALESVKISTVPQYIDAIFVGEEGESRFPRVKQLYVVGANAGAYPREGLGGGIVTENDAELWRRHGINLLTAHDRNCVNKINLINTLLKAEKLTVTATASTAESLMRIQLKKLFNITPIKDGFSYSCFDPDAIMVHIGTEKKLIKEINAGKVAMEGYERARFVKSYCCVGGDAFKNNCLSPSSIEKFYGCPYRFFAEKILKIKPREVAGEDVRLIGTFMHSVMERYYRSYGLGEKDIERKAAAIAEEILSEPVYRPLLRSGAPRLIARTLIERAVRAAQKLDAAFSQGRMRPLYLEYSFGAGSENPGMTLDVDGEEYTISGFVDRVDIGTAIAGGREIKCVSVVDYKSSRKDFNRADFLRGLKLQLPVYTGIAAKNLDAVPIAMLYAEMQSKFKAAGKKNKITTGIVVNDELFLSMLDRNYGDLSATFLPYRGSSNRAQSAVTREEFDDIINTAVELMKNAVRLIKSRALTPLKSEACRYCDYYDMCRADDFIADKLSKSERAESGNEAI